MIRRKHNVLNASRQMGLSLIELMVALAIGSLLILGLVQVFAASRAAYLTSEGNARVQENARFAMDFLQRDIRMAGHFGCVNDQAHWVQEEGDPLLHFGAITSGSGAALDFSVSVEGHEAPNTGPANTLTLGGAWAAPTGIPALTPAPVGGSDVLVMRYLAPEGVPVTNIAGGGSGETISFNPARGGALTSDGVATPLVFGVGDCTHADVFRASATNIAAGTITTDGATGLAGRYTPQPTGQTMLYRAESVVYYIGRASADREPALYRARANSGGVYTSEELVEGIESLQLLYGQDTRGVLAANTPPIGNITRYGTAAQVRTAGASDIPNAWRTVGVVQVGILARSPNPAAATSASAAIRVLGTGFAPATNGDGRYRASYESTIALRNRLFGN